jgi:hypothetical protein
MATEMVCGNCHGRLLVEHTGVVVACPHCGTHLQAGEVPPPAPAIYFSKTEVPASIFPGPAPQHPSPNQSPAVQYEQIAPPSAPIPESHGPAPDSELKLPTIQVTMPPPLPVSNVEGLPAESPPPSPAIPGIPEDSTILTQPAQGGAKSESSTLPETEDWMPEIDPALPEPLKASASENVEPDSAYITLEPMADEHGSTPAAATSLSPTEIWKISQLTGTSLSEHSAATPVTPPVIPQSESEPQVDGALDTLPLPEFPAPGPSSDAVNPVQEPRTSGMDVTRNTSSDVTSPLEYSPFQTESVRQVSEPPFVRQQDVVSRRTFNLVLSFASAMTLGFVYLLFRMFYGSALDLPDRKPAFRNGQTGISIYPDGQLPWSHRLKLGQTRQFGSLRVTPLKVTKGLLEFEHESGEAGGRREPSFAPVLKLWMRFENVSSDQTFPALDEDLVYTQVRDKSNTFRSNNFLRVEGDIPARGKKISVYNWLASSDFVMRGQKLDTPLHPGETWETYIPTDDESDIDTLQGPLAWRLHFRKGYNRTTFRGVTTVVEVDFDSSDIQADS